MLGAILVDALRAIDEIRKGKIKDIYVLTGENDFIKERLIFWLRDQTGAEVIRVDSENIDVIHDLGSYSLFTPQRIVVIDLPSKKAIREDALKQVRMGLVNGIVVIKGDAKITEAELVECKPLPKKEAVNWIVAEFKVKGVSCDVSTAQQLLDMCDGDLWAASTEIDKLSLITKKVTSRHLEEFVVGGLLPGDYFTVMDALVTGNQRKTETEIRNLIRQGEALQQVFVFVYRIFSLAWKIAEFNLSTSELAQQSGRSPYFVMRCGQIGKRYTKTQLRRIINGFFDLDLKNKLGQLDEEGVLSGMLNNIFPNEGVDAFSW